MTIAYVSPSSQLFRIEMRGCILLASCVPIVQHVLRATVCFFLQSGLLPAQKLLHEVASDEACGPSDQDLAHLVHSEFASAGATRTKPNAIALLSLTLSSLSGRSERRRTIPGLTSCPRPAESKITGTPSPPSGATAIRSIRAPRWQNYESFSWTRCHSQDIARAGAGAPRMPNLRALSEAAARRRLRRSTRSRERASSATMAANPPPTPIVACLYWLRHRPLGVCCFEI